MKNSIYVILFLIVANFLFSQNENSDATILIEYKRANFGENWWEKSGPYDYKLVEDNVLAKAYLNIKPSSIFNQIELESGYKSEINIKKDSAWVWLPVIGPSEMIKFKSSKNKSKVHEQLFTPLVTSDGDYFKEGFTQKLPDSVRELRQIGLMIGIELKQKATPFLQTLLDTGIIALPAGPTVIRLLPPLTIEEKQLDTVIDALRRTL